jgi:hypothetical protein
MSIIFRLFTLFLFLNIAIFAQTADKNLSNPRQTLGLTPAFIDASIKPGQTYTQEFTISNGTATRLKFQCSTLDYWYDAENKTQFGRPDTLPHSSSTWVVFTPSDLIIEPNSSATVKAVISVPKTAVGGYYTIPIFEGEPAPSAEAIKNQPVSQATFGIRMGGLMMLATEKTSNYDVQILKSQVIPPTVSTPLNLSLEIKNSGNTHVRLRGQFAFLDAQGKVVGRGKIEENRFLPEQHYTFNAPWTGNLTSGKYTALLTLTYDRAGLEPASLVQEIPFEVK